MPSQNEIEGKGRKAVGIVKEKLGEVTGNQDLEAEGSAERTAGGFQAGVGKVIRKVDEAIADTARDLKKP